MTRGDDAQTSAHRGAVHATRDRLFEARHREHEIDVVAFVRQLHGVYSLPSHLRKITASTKRFSFAGDHDDAYRIVIRRVAERVQKLVRHLRTDRVASLRIEERDRRHRIRGRDFDFSVRAAHDATDASTFMPGLN